MTPIINICTTVDNNNIDKNVLLFLSYDIAHSLCVTDTKSSHTARHLPGIWPVTLLWD